MANLKLNLFKSLKIISEFILIFVIVYLIFYFIFVFFGKTDINLIKLKSIITLEQKSSLINATLNLIREILVAFIIANLFSVISGYLIVDKFKKFRQLVLSIGVVLKATPLIILIPLLYQIKFIPYGFVSSYVGILGAVLIAFFPTLIETIKGFDTIPNDVIQYYRKSIKLSKKDVYLIKLRFALSHMFPAFKISITLCVVGAIVGELVIVSSNTMAELIFRGANYSDINLYFIALFISGFIGVFFYSIVETLERLTNWWEYDK